MTIQVSQRHCKYEIKNNLDDVADITHNRRRITEIHTF